MSTVQFPSAIIEFGTVDEISFSNFAFLDDDDDDDDYKQNSKNLFPKNRQTFCCNLTSFIDATEV